MFWISAFQAMEWIIVDADPGPIPAPALAPTTRGCFAETVESDEASR
jgi:hypothetical protein